MGVYWMGNSGVRAQGSRAGFITAHECGCHKEWPARECYLCANTGEPSLRVLKMAEALQSKTGHNADMMQRSQTAVTAQDRASDILMDVVLLVNEIERGRR